MKKTKIICSIGPASANMETMNKMVEAGMNVARINFSHATAEEKINVVKVLNEVRKNSGKNIGLLYDTKGPEFRNGNLLNNSINLVEGNTIRIVKEDILGTEKEFSVNYSKAVDSLNVGDTVLLENGLMNIKVISKENDGVTCKIIVGGTLGNKKSLSVPGVKLDIPFLNDIDKEDILYAGSHEGDFLALSFVSSKEDVLSVRALLEENNMNIAIISKIESQTGIDNINEILDVSEGIMIARGDLGVEVPMEKLPFVQKELIKKAREKNKIAIVATEMLESMKKNSRPTRAEITDITSAVLDGTDAVMLSGETTTGLYPVEAVTYMANICKEAEYNYVNTHVKDVKSNIIRRAICRSAVEAAQMLDAKTIVTASLRGRSSKYISNIKPICPVLAAVTDESIANSLTLNYAVYPLVVKEYGSTDEIVSEAINNAKRVFDLVEGDSIIITGGFPNNIPNKSTNFLKIEVI